MRTLFVFNHPAPYKVMAFNELCKLTDIQVVFERKKAKDRPDSFYQNNVYDFPAHFINKGLFGRENSFSGELRKYIKLHHQEYDVIVMNGYSMVAEMKAIRYMIKRKIPYVLQINGGVIKKDSFIKGKLKRYFISHAYKYLSPCKEADEYLLHYGAREKDIFHYPYGNYYEKDVLHQPLARHEKDTIREKYNLPYGALFINASQFIERKNNIQLIDIFKDRGETLLLVGSGVEKSNYEKHIKQNSIENIILMDYQPKDKLFEILKSADCFITLSHEDIFGHTTLEAMANGLPVISSDRVVSSRNIIKPGLNGFLVDITDDRTITGAIDRYDTLSSSEAIKTARGNTIEKSATRIKEILEEMK